MISGKFDDISLAQLMSNIYNMRAGKLGKIFVRYAEPIDLNEYMAN